MLLKGNQMDLEKKTFRQWVVEMTVAAAVYGGSPIKEHLQMGQCNKKWIITLLLQLLLFGVILQGIDINLFVSCISLIFPINIKMLIFFLIFFHWYLIAYKIANPTSTIFEIFLLKNKRILGCGSFCFFFFFWWV